MFRGGDKNCAERTLAYCEADGGVRSAGTPLARRHAQHAIDFGIETAARCVAGVKNGSGDRLVGIQFLMQSGSTQCAAPFLRCESRNVAKGLTQMRWRGLYDLCECVERGELFGGFEMFAGGCDQRRFALRGARFIRSATFAGTKAGGLCVCRGIEEFNIFPQRCARSAGWAAINIGGTYGVNEVSVGGGVTGTYGSPAHIERFEDRKSTRLNSSHVRISYAVFCLKKKMVALVGWRCLWR